MEDEKYFIPDIEDIRVGYECEWQSKIRKETWHKEIFDVDLVNIFYDEYEHSDEDEPLSEQFRTPYLTKKQIEAEGWNIWEQGPSAEGTSFIKDKYSCQLLMRGNVNALNAGIDPNSTNLTISQYKTGDVLFLGECKSINEFRYICKLLKIN